MLNVLRFPYFKATGLLGGSSYHAGIDVSSVYWCLAVQLSAAVAPFLFTLTRATLRWQCDIDYRKCSTNTCAQPDTKSNPNPNPSPNPKQTLY